MQHIVIIGAGQAGAGAAIGLRDFGFEGKITLIGEEPVAPYERPELSKAYAKGEIGFEKLVMLTPEQADEKQIDLHLDAPVTGVDLKAKTVTIRNESFAYSHLIFATGGQARRLSLTPELDAISHVVRTKADADRLGKALKSARTAVVIGGGWLGLEAASTCRSLGLETHVIEVADRLCARVAPLWLSEQLASLQRADGVTLHLGQRPECKQSQITIGAQVLQPDVVIQAVGLTANDALAQSAGLSCSDGIEVDGEGRAGQSDVFAIGDCARDMSAGGLRQESWQNANLTSRKVAAVIAGAEAPKSENPWFWSNQAQTNIQMLGICEDGHQQVERQDVKSGGTIRFYLKEGRLQGCIALNAARSLGMSRRFVGADIRLDLEKLADGALPLAKCIAP